MRSLSDGEALESQPCHHAPSMDQFHSVMMCLEMLQYKFSTSDFRLPNDKSYINYHLMLQPVVYNLSVRVFTVSVTYKMEEMDEI